MEMKESCRRRLCATIASWLKLETHRRGMPKRNIHLMQCGARQSVVMRGLVETSPNPMRPLCTAPRCAGMQAQKRIVRERIALVVCKPADTRAVVSAGQSNHGPRNKLD